MNLKIILILLILMPWEYGFCQGNFGFEKKVFDKDSITSFSLQLPNGTDTHLSSPSKELLVIAFLSPECPLCKNYSSKLISLKNKYVNEADFLGIIPGSFDADEVVEFQKEYMPSWQIVKDTSLQLTQYLEGEVTPEVIVINSKSGRLVYKGAIDDWVVSLGKTKNRVSNFYLDVAINNFLNDKPAIPFTRPVGCLINDF
jgi:thiol-disulfide isomerase/thioredoxin